VEGTIPIEGAALALSHHPGAVSMFPHGYSETGPELIIMTTGGYMSEWDGDAAVFGMVVEGHDVVKAISEIPHDEFNNPDQEIIIQEMIIVRTSEDNGVNEPQENQWFLYLAVAVIIVVILVVILLLFNRSDRSS
jgi:hypothetical protein